MFQLDKIEQFGNPRGRLLPLDVKKFGVKGEVLLDGQVGIEVDLLRDDADQFFDLPVVNVRRHSEDR